MTRYSSVFSPARFGRRPGGGPGGGEEDPPRHGGLVRLVPQFGPGPAPPPPPGPPGGGPDGPGGAEAGRLVPHILVEGRRRELRVTTAKFGGKKSSLVGFPAKVGIGNGFSPKKIKNKFEGKYVSARAVCNM